MYLGLVIFLFIVIGGVALLIRVPFFTFLQGDPRALPDRLHHGEFGGGPARRRSR